MKELSERISIFLPSFAGGGAEKVTVRLANGLAERGSSVDLILVKAEGPCRSEVSEQVRIVDLKGSRVLFSLPALVRYLRREKPKAMLSALNHANIIAIWAKWLSGVSTRIFVCEHNTLSIATKHGRSLLPRIMPLFIRSFYPAADGVVVVSKGVADDLKQVTGIPGKKISIIYNPVVTPELCQKAAAPLDHPWFCPGEPPVILAVGRLTAQKDFPTLVQAFAQVRGKYPCRLLILGEGPDRIALESLIKELDLGMDVSLPGFVENPFAYMSRCSVFVLSSLWEGLPTVLIEALACGAPVVSTDCPSGPREILDDGKYGALVPTGDFPALAEEISWAVEGKLPHPPDSSWSRYTKETIIDQYLQLLGGSRQ